MNSIEILKQLFSTYKSKIAKKGVATTTKSWACMRDYQSEQKQKCTHVEKGKELYTYVYSHEGGGGGDDGGGDSSNRVRKHNVVL